MVSLPLANNSHPIDVSSLRAVVRKQRDPPVVGPLPYAHRQSAASERHPSDRRIRRFSGSPQHSRIPSRPATPPLSQSPNHPTAPSHRAAAAVDPQPRHRRSAASLLRAVPAPSRHHPTVPPPRGSPFASARGPGGSSMAIGDNVEQEDGHTSNLRKEPLQPSTSANDVHPSAAAAATLHLEGCPCSPPRGGLRPPARGSRSPAVAAACSRVEDGHTSISSKEALPPSTYTKGRRVSSRVLQVDCFVGRCLPTHCISRMSE